MKRLIIAILAVLCIAECACAASNAKDDVKKGNILYNKGKFEEALSSYEEAFLDAPDSDIVNFDLGTALYKTGDYEGAIEHFEKALVSDNPSVEQKASYNLGNAEYKFGIGKEDSNPTKAVGHLEKSLRHYERAFELNPEDEDAKYNYEFVKKELERLQKKLAQRQRQGYGGEEKEEGQQSEMPQQQSRQPGGEEQQEQQEAPQAQQQFGQQEQEERRSAATKSDAEEKQKDSLNVSEAQESAGEMSEREVEMLLESYRQEEEPRGMYRQRIRVRGLPEATKDW